ncbi:MAG: T9SS type A sorting domain-containing protein [Bacteroidetes bacterium]|nr:T9SS type A sorting domain-containing protein [Bacteroidota bacterium]
MVKQLFFSLVFLISVNVNAQTCGTGGCAISTTNSTGQYPTATFSTTSSGWTTVSAYMNAGNWTLFYVQSGHVYEWTYCSNFGGSQAWDAELTLFNNSTYATLCYANNCGLPGCTTAPYIQWTATYTGVVRLLTTVSGCSVNTGSPYSTLIWRDLNGTAPSNIMGLDVSDYQGTINWTQVKATGITFAWAKATEGVTVNDAQYLNNASNGVSAGVYMGAYHFARPENNTASNEANHFLSIAASHITSCELPPALDLEDPPSGTALTSYFTASQLSTWVTTWCNAVYVATGIKPVVYTSGSIAGYLNNTVTSYGLWMADPDGSYTAPPASTGVWPSWNFKQYSWTGTVNGISGSSNVDLDVYNGTLNNLKTLMGCVVTNLPSEQKIMRDFVIFPNPASNELNIVFDESLGMLNMAIYDINGKLITTGTASTKTKVDLSSFDTGLYILQLSGTNISLSKKFTVVR